MNQQQTYLPLHEKEGVDIYVFLIYDYVSREWNEYDLHEFQGFNQINLHIFIMRFHEWSQWLTHIQTKMQKEIMNSILFSINLRLCIDVLNEMVDQTILHDSIYIVIQIY